MKGIGDEGEDTTQLLIIGKGNTFEPNNQIIINFVQDNKHGPEP